MPRGRKRQADGAASRLAGAKKRGGGQSDEDDSDCFDVDNAVTPVKKTKVSARASKSSASGATPTRTTTGGTLTRCSRCKVPSTDASFALALGLPHASSDQCEPCWTAWVSVATMLPWKDFCALCEDGGEFADNVSSAVERMKTREKAAAVQDFVPEGVKDRTKFGLRIFRKGRIVFKSGLKVKGVKFTPKQLKLKNAISLSAGAVGSQKWSQAWLLSNESSKLEAEVFAETALSTEKGLLQLGASEVEGIMDHVVDRARSSTEATQVGILDLLQGKSPTWAELEERASKTTTNKLSRRVGSQPKADDNSSSRDSLDEEEEHSSPSEDDEPDAVSAGEGTEAPPLTNVEPKCKGAKSSGATPRRRLARKSTCISSGVSLTIAGTDVGKCSSSAGHSTKIGGAKTVAYDSRSVASNNTKGSTPVKGKAGLQPSYWLEKLEVAEALIKPLDQRSVYQADQCVQRHLKLGGREAEEASRLKKHLKLCTAAELLQEDAVPNIDEDSELEAHVKLLSGSNIQLAPSNLVGIMQRFMKKCHSDVSCSLRVELITAYVRRALPFADDGADATSFDLKSPSLSALVGIVAPQILEAKFRTWIFSDLLFPRVAECDSKGKADSLSGLVTACQSCFEIPEECDMPESTAKIMVDASDVLTALQLLCDRAVTEKTEVAALDLLKKMHTIAEHSRDTSLLASCGRVVKESEWLGNHLKDLITADPSWPKTVETIKACLASLAANNDPAASIDSVYDALIELEKYKPTLPAGSCDHIESVVVRRIAELHKWLSGPKKCTNELAIKLQDVLQLAQRAFPKESSFDTMLANVAVMLQGFTSEKVVGQLISLMSKFGDDEIGDVHGFSGGLREPY